ncbi:MAG: hypothetical protein ACI8XO_000367 [Verrucomicrobiales bacterium]|jgi:hypothetical protein
MKELVMRKFSNVLIVLTASLLSTGQAAQKTLPANDAELPGWVTEQITSLQPKPEEKRLDEIGWADDIRHALRLAKQHQRPIFLFTHDGRINLGRC